MIGSTGSGFGASFARRVTCWVGIVALCAHPLRAQDGQGEVGAAGTARARVTRLEALRTEAEITLDGRLDEDAWLGAAVARDFVQQVPDEGRPASEPTEVRVLVDDDALYVGARLSDGDAREIVRRLARRDQDVQADWFYVFVDGYRDRRTAFGFGVNASGVQRDVRYSDDDVEDASWDGVWGSAVAVDEEGWGVELRIPFSQLRFDASNGDGIWGINFLRRVARKNETSYWMPIPQGSASFVSRFGELEGVSDLKPPRRIEAIPYSVARVARAPVDRDDPFHAATEGFGAIGGDVRVGLGSAMTLSATLNPDFGQVEADPAVVNLTAFETFQQERRPFFVEGADLFTPYFPTWPPLFYSRRIGRAPQGGTPSEAVYDDRPSATTILGALKVSGKKDGWSLGVLDALTARERVRYVDTAGASSDATVEPATHYFVGRVARELNDGHTGIGTMATVTDRPSLEPRLSFLHSRALAVVVDGFHRFGDTYEVKAGLTGSRVAGTPDAISRTQRAPGHYFQRPDADYLTYDSTRTALNGASAHAFATRIRGPLKWGLYGEAVSPGFEVNDLGFNPSLDHIQGNAWFRYESYTPGPLFRSWNLGTMAMAQSTWGGERKELTNDLGFYFQLPNYWSGGVWAMRHRPGWDPTGLRGGPALRKPGRWMGSFDVGSDTRKAVSGNGFVFWQTEDDTDGRQLSVSGSLLVRPSSRFDLSVGPGLFWGRNDWQYVGRRAVGGDDVYLVGAIDQRTVSVAARMNYAVSPVLSLQVYARPFLASGRYSAFREVRDARATDFQDRFRTYGAGEIVDTGGSFRIDRDGDGLTDVTLSDPSFNTASLQMNTVVRWEFRPGSTLFGVWTHDRQSYGDGPLALASDFEDLMSAPARNVFQLKVSYWMGG